LLTIRGTEFCQQQQKRRKEGPYTKKKKGRRPSLTKVKVGKDLVEGEKKKGVFFFPRKRNRSARPCFPSRKGKGGGGACDAGGKGIKRDGVWFGAGKEKRGRLVH